MTKPSPVEWSADMLAQMHALRAAGETYDAIAAKMGLTRWAVIEQIRRMPAATRPEPPQPPDKPETERRDRPPRPPGHPETWRMLTAGTVLHDEPFPTDGRPA